MERSLLLLCFMFIVIFAGIFLFENLSKPDKFYKVCHNISNCDNSHNYTIILHPTDTITTIDSSISPQFDVNYVVIEAGNNIIYRLPILIRTSVLKTKCNYTGVVKPYLSCNSTSIGSFDGISVQTKMKQESLDIDAVKMAINNEKNDTKLKARYIFLLAQEYERKNDCENAIKWYLQRLEMNGWLQQMFYSQYRIAMCQLRNNSTESAKKSFLKAYTIDPFRKEPLYYLARMARVKNEYSLCLLYSSSAMQIGVPWSDAFFVEKNIYNWKLRDEHALCLYYTGRKNTAGQHWQYLLDTQPGMPANIRERIIKNLNFI